MDVSLFVKMGSHIELKNNVSNTLDGGTASQTGRARRRDMTFYRSAKRTFNITFIEVSPTVLELLMGLVQ
jgi:hypothetical protein